MRLSITRLLSLAFFALAPVAANAVVQHAPLFITTPPAGGADSFFEVAATATGFVATWDRYVATPPSLRVYAQRFTAQGKPNGPAVNVSGAISVLGEPELLPLTPTTMAIFWSGGGYVQAAIYNLANNTVGPVKTITKTSDHIHDVTRLTNGAIAIVTTQIDLSNPNDVRDKITLTLVSATLAVLKPAQSINGTGFKDLGLSYLDQTIVTTAAGGVVLFRDRVTGNIMGRAFANNGALPGQLFKVNTTANPIGTYSDTVYSRIRAVRLTNGAIAVSWVSMESKGQNHFDIRLRMLNANGAPLGTDFLAQPIAGAQYSPELVVLPAGKFLVEWKSDNITTSAYNIYYRAYSGAGVPSYAPRLAQTLTIADSGVIGNLTGVEAARLADGSLVTLFGGYFNPRIRAFGIGAPQL